MKSAVTTLARQGRLSWLTPSAHGVLRGFASVPEPVVDSEGQAEAVPLPGSADGAVLLRLPQRPFGATAELPSSVLENLTGGQPAKRVAVVREAFSAFDEPITPLSQLVASLGKGAVALSSATQDAANRLIVDEYEAPSAPGQPYKLLNVSTDICRFLRSQGLRVALVPDVNRAQKGQGNGAEASARGGPAQSSNHVLMVAPTAFGFNEQAAQDNSFMHKAPMAHEDSSVSRKVLREYAALHKALTDGAGVNVSLFQHDLGHCTPDAVFPNNWFSTHPAGEAAGGVGKSTLVLYPMKCPNRAAERRPDVIGAIKGVGGYDRVVDMSGKEQDKQYFEGTGVLVLDRINGVAYVDLSERADERLAQEWVQSLGYKDLITFRSYDKRGKPVYHTNVMMAIGTDVAIVCSESVQDKKERAHLMQRLGKHHEIVDISLDQMDALCGNAIEVVNGNGLPVMAMSTGAHDALTPEQRATLRRHVADIVHAPIPTLERIGGGGVRCAIAELF